MIKIDVNNINNWDTIKEKHSEWYKINILPNIRRVYNKLYEKDLNAFVKKLKKNSKDCKNKLLFKKYKEHKKNEKDFIKKYLNILEKIIKKGKNFVIEEKEKFDEDLFDKSFLENLENDLKKDSVWYKENILPNICKAYNELYNKSENDSIKKYLNILKKIKEGEKDFIVEKKSVKEFEKLDINKEYLPQNLLFYEEYLPDELFKYANLYGEGQKIDEKETWSRHKLLSLMGIEICPYCQRNYISNYTEKNDKKCEEEDNKEVEENKVEENNDEKTTATLDHFYPKADYPFLALSLYNFVPSCQVCNSIFKGDADTCDSIYPYEEGFDELGVKFKTSKEVIYEILGEKNFDFSVEIDCKNIEDKEKKDKVENSIDNLGLDRVYKKSHNQYIQDLLYTVEKYPENYLEACGEMFENDNDKKKQLEEYFKDIVKEPYRKRIENGEPLAKLTKDILEEFNIKI